MIHVILVWEWFDVLRCVRSTIPAAARCRVARGGWRRAEWRRARHGRPGSSSRSSSPMTSRRS